VLIRLVVLKGLGRVVGGSGLRCIVMIGLDGGCEMLYWGGRGTWLYSEGETVYLSQVTVRVREGSGSNLQAKPTWHYHTRYFANPLAYYCLFCERTKLTMQVSSFEDWQKIGKHKHASHL